MSDPNDPEGDNPLGEGNPLGRPRRVEVPSTLPVAPRPDAAIRRVLVIAGERVSTHPLPEHGQIRIGRGDDVELRIDDPSVSREHAHLFLEKGKPVVVADAGSSNGTRVRGKALVAGQKVAIAPGETFEVGSALLMLQSPAEAEHVQAARGEGGGLVIEDRTMAGIHALAERVAKSSISVLLLGETGVGKDVLARRIHAMSPRVDKPFLALNCGALSEQLLESELFGHERGSFTGAVEAKQGLLESADGGTVFLDEVGELPMSVQVKLLRVLEERQVRRVGGLKARAFDVRFLAATNRDLGGAVQGGSFRADLFYRLNGIALVIPPLRQRTGEIAELARRFVDEASGRAERTPVPVITPEALAWLVGHHWPGNIRELQNTMERAVLLCTGDEITLEHLPPSVGPAGQARVGQDGRGDADADPERQKILDALEQCAGNQTRAARMLGISRNTLLARLDAYGILRPRKPVRSSGRDE
ncbi:MAG: sigma 54-interacting transcriptional regulator [Myxococcales bacterium]|nr:sigma 54-interacting transcriptional regulator [Myxococcales bacterium]